MWEVHRRTPGCLGVRPHGGRTASTACFGPGGAAAPGSLDLATAVGQVRDPQRSVRVGGSGLGLSACMRCLRWWRCRRSACCHSIGRSRCDASRAVIHAPHAAWHICSRHVVAVPSPRSKTSHELLVELYDQMTSVEKPCDRINKCDAIHVTVVTGAHTCGVWRAFVTFHRGRPNLRTIESLIAND